jgi:hypothetical protein
MALRRLLSFVLLLAFGLPLAAPAFGLTADADAGLPACCRRNGAHHCAKSAEQIEAQLNGPHITVVRSKCPCCPVGTVAASHQQPVAYGHAPTTLGSFNTISITTSQVAAWARASEAGARHKRGPPAIRLF